MYYEEHYAAIVQENMSVDRLIQVLAATRELRDGDAAEMEAMEAENVRLTELLQVRQQPPELLLQALQHAERSDVYLTDVYLMKFARSELAKLKASDHEHTD